MIDHRKKIEENTKEVLKCDGCGKEAIEYSEWHKKLQCQNCGLIVVDESMANTCRVCRNWYMSCIPHNQKVYGVRYIHGRCARDEQEPFNHFRHEQDFKCFFCEIKSEYFGIVYVKQLKEGKWKQE